MDLDFHVLSFEIENGEIWMRRCGTFEKLHSRFVEVQISGENKNTHMGVKMTNSSEGVRLRYCSHSLNGNTLRIVQRSDLVEIESCFTCYDDTSALRAQTVVRNISKDTVVLEEVSAFTVTGLPLNSEFTRFLQSHHKECQPVRRSFMDWGLDPVRPEGQKRIACANVGSWSTKEELPQGIITESNGNCLMFQIESNASWYYEISDTAGEYYLYLGGPNLSFGNWSCALAPDESYISPFAAIAFGSDLNAVVGSMTRYRRHIAGNFPVDQKLPIIFNEYMHLSWDSPTADNTRKIAPIAAQTGAEYYVIDCGWHNEEPGDKVYPYVGQWIQSDTRFPDGIRETTDYIRTLGMKAGLWIEPEIIGYHCEEMLEYYDDNCFLQRFGKRLTVMNRHFLDYRNPKVTEYMSESIRRMVEDYGAEYIKFDYNQDCGVGTDRMALTSGKGLEDCAEAFLSWIRQMHTKYPDVVFEGCASGGMRMDHKTLSAFSLMSTSDQIYYERYPYIAGNILSAVLPEQAAVWSYPVTEDCSAGDVTDDRIAMNMINSFLGRMHLAGHLERLDERQMELICEGVRYYNSLTQMKKRALPFFPNGFTRFGADSVCAGLRDGNKLYLAVWNLADAGIVTARIANIQRAWIAYPSKTDAEVFWSEQELSVKFPRGSMAAFIEIDLL